MKDEESVEKLWINSNYLRIHRKTNSEGDTLLSN